MMGRNLDAWRRVRVPAGAKARPRASAVGTLGGRNPEIVAAGEKLSDDHHAIDTGGAACYNRDTASLDRFQAQHKLGKPGYNIRPAVFPIAEKSLGASWSQVQPVTCHAAGGTLW